MPKGGEYGEILNTVLIIPVICIFNPLYIGQTMGVWAFKKYP